MEPVNGSLRRSILDISRKMLVDEGFNRISMRKIAQKVGCSATSIYLYFKNKDALLHSLIEEGFEKLYEILSALNHPDKSPARKIEDYCRAFINFGLNNPEYYEIMFQLHPKHMERYPVEKFRRARRNTNLFMNALQELNDERMKSPEDARIWANVFVANIHGGISLLNAGRVDSRVEREKFIDTLVAGILAGSGELKLSHQT